MSEYEAVIEDLGAFGPAQIQTFIMVTLFEMPCAWGIFVHPVFAGRAIPWTCDYGDTANTTGTLSCTSNSNSSDWSQNCTAQCDSIEYCGEMTTIVSEWDLRCDRAHIPSLITTMQMAGGLLGSLICGQLSDIFGRRKILIGIYALFIVSSLCSAFANSWILYMALKMIVGAAMSGTMVVNYAMSMEFVTPAWRTFCGTVGFWNIGVMSLALLAYLIPNWRYLTMTCALLGMPMLAFWWFLPESPRWLLLQGRQDEAEAILTKMAHRNKKPVPDFSRLHAFVQRELNYHKYTKNYSYWDLFRNFKMSKTTLTIWFTWLVCSCVYFGTTISAAKLHGNIYLNLFLSGLVEIPGLIFVLIFNNRVGRRLTLCMLITGGGVACLCVLLVNTYADEQLMWLSTMFALLGKTGISGGWAAALVSSAEVFPTVVRNIGMASSSVMATLGSVFAPQIAQLDGLDGSVPYIIFGILGVSSGILCIFLPETLNRPLPDTLPKRVYCLCCDKEDTVDKDIDNKQLSDLMLTNEH